MAAVRAKRKAVLTQKKSANGNGANGTGKKTTIGEVDTELRNGQEWIAASRAAVLASEKRFEEESALAQAQGQGRRLSQVNLADVSLAVNLDKEAVKAQQQADEAEKRLEVNGHPPAKAQETTVTTNGETHGCLLPPKTSSSEVSDHDAESWPVSKKVPSSSASTTVDGPSFKPSQNFNFAADDLDGFSSRPDDHASLDHALEEGMEHKTDSLLVQEDRNVRKLTRYIPPEIQANFTKGEHTFFQMLEEDVITINHFFLKQEDFFLDKINIIVEQLDRLIKEEEEHQAQQAKVRQQNQPPRPTQPQNPADHVKAVVAAAKKREAQTGGTTDDRMNGVLVGLDGEHGPAQQAVYDELSPNHYSVLVRSGGVTYSHPNSQLGRRVDDGTQTPEVELSPVLGAARSQQQLHPRTPPLRASSSKNLQAHHRNQSISSRGTDGPTFHDNEPAAAPPSPPFTPAPPASTLSHTSPVPMLPPTEIPPTISAPPSSLASPPPRALHVLRQQSSSGLGDEGAEEDPSAVAEIATTRQSSESVLSRTEGSPTASHGSEENGAPAPASGSDTETANSGLAGGEGDEQQARSPTASHTPPEVSPPAESLNSPGTSEAQATIAQHMHMQLKFRLLTAQKPWKVLEKALTELYRGLHLLRNYKILNFTAFVKILKKYDKLGLHDDWTPTKGTGETADMNETSLGINGGSVIPQSTQGWKAGLTLLPRIQSTHFLASPILKAFIRRVELIFAQTFTDGDQKQALDNLRPFQPPLRASVLFSLGLLLGVCGLGLLVLLILVGYIQDSSASPSINIPFPATLPVWRGLGLVILHFWGWSICVHLFHRYRINFEFICEINPKTELKFEQMILAAATLAALWFILLDLYLFISLVKDSGAWHGIHAGWVPFTLFIFLFFICFMPFDTFFRPTRYYLLRTLGKIVTAPFHSVDFRDFCQSREERRWYAGGFVCAELIRVFCCAVGCSDVGDQLCSLVNVFNDVMYSFCYLTTGHFLLDAHSDPQCTSAQSSAVWVLACLPYYWRLCQCLRKYRDNPPANRRQLWNAGKYSCSIITTLLSLLNKNYPNTAFRPVLDHSRSLYCAVYVFMGCLL